MHRGSVCIPTEERLSRKPRSHAPRGNAYESGSMRKSHCLVGFSGAPCEYGIGGGIGMHSHAERGNEVSGGFCDNLRTVGTREYCYQGFEYK